LSSIKSFSNEVANRYALALFELAKENSELDIIEKNISDLLQLYNNNSELKNFIKNPTQSQSNQLKILNNLAIKMSLSKITNNFLSILITKRRIFFLKNIIQNFLLLVSKKKGELKASLITSKNLTSEEIKNLNTELSQAMEATVAFDHTVDENLIGGLKVQIGSLMIDTSIKNKLKKYEQTMLEA
tara:strand:- start:7 stop:564 length:558 start_codon:yes stop_codon:yes gene_type:complete